MHDDYYGKAFFGILAVCAMFLAPIIYLGFQMQGTAEVRANEYTEEFIDNCRASAYFTDKDYEDYITKMGLLGVTWDIKMYHYKTTYSPDGTGGVIATEIVHTRDDIANALYSDLSEDITRYDMKKGDRFEIVAVSKSEFAGVGFTHIFDRGGINKIYIQCGEQIDNYTD